MQYSLRQYKKGRREAALFLHQGLLTLGGFERFHHGIAEHNFFLLVQAVDGNTLVS